MPESMDVIEAGRGREYTGKEVLERFSELKSDRAPVEDVWQQIADNLLGRREFTDRGMRGRNRQQRIYNTVGQIAADTLAGALHSLLTNPAQKWFSLALEDPALMEMDGVAAWLEDSRDRILARMSPKSGFTTNISEVYLDLVSFGSGSLWVGDDPRLALLFSARPLREVYFDEDVYGRIDYVCREIEMTPRQIVDLFGKLAPKFYHELVENGKGGGAQNLHAIIQAIDLNPDYDPGRLGPRGMPWRSVIVDGKTGEELQRGGYYELPCLISRWSKDAGEIYGRGPGHLAISDQQMANEQARTTLTTAQKSANPPLLVPNEGVLNKMRLVPGAMNVYRSRAFRGENPIFELPHGNYQISDQVMQRTEVRIEMAFHREIVKAVQDPRMTATQVAELAQLAQRQLSPILGRLQTELLEPIVDRCYGLMARKGLFAEPPPEISGMELKVEYVSPVQRAQKEGEARAVVELMTIIANLAQSDPDALMVVDLEETIRFLAEAKSVPAKLLRTRRELALMMEAQRKQAAEQQQLAMAATMAKAAGQAAPAIEAGTNAALAAT